MKGFIQYIFPTGQDKIARIIIMASIIHFALFNIGLIVTLSGAAK